MHFKCITEGLTTESLGCFGTCIVWSGSPLGVLKGMKVVGETLCWRSFVPAMQLRGCMCALKVLIEGNSCFLVSSRAPWLAKELTLADLR